MKKVIFVLGMSLSVCLAGCIKQEKIEVKITKSETRAATMYSNPRCKILGHVKNGTDYKIEDLVILLRWNESYVRSYNLDLNARQERDVEFGSMFGMCASYFDIDQTPKIEIDKCKVEGKNQGECFDLLQITDAR